MSAKQMPRKRIAGGRKAGVVVEWKGAWGWVKPSTPVKHAEAQKNNGKLYLHSNDMRGGATAAKDAKVEFFVYTDGRGLGAEDATKVGGATKGAACVEKLPPGWKKMFSEENDEHYYWNAETKESSWVRPGGDAGDDDEAHDALPLGWTKEWDAEQNEWYFWNKLSRTASWQQPKAKRAAVRRVAPTAPEAEEEEDEETPAPAAPRVDGPILGQQRMSGIVTQWQGFFGWISPLMAHVPADLKTLLARSQDKVYVNWREVKDGIKLKVGSHVDFNIFADDNGLGASDVSAHQAGNGSGVSAGERAVVQLQKEWAKQDGKKAKFAKTPATKNYGVAEAAAGDDADGDLLPGWDQCWSEEHQCNFYWHKASKSSSWERPAVPDDGESSIARPVAAVQKQNKAEERKANSKVATPLTPLTSKGGTSMTPNTPTAAAVSRNGQAQPSAKRARKA